MKTESMINNMNTDTPNRKTRAKNMRRRILASICAVAIALLQCAVIVTVGTEDAHAEDKISIKVDYKDKKNVAGSVDLDNTSKNGNRSFDYEVEEEDPETGGTKIVNKTVKLSGPTINDIIKAANISTTGINSVTIGGNTVSKGDFGNTFIVYRVTGDPLPNGYSNDQVMDRICSGSDSIESIIDKSKVDSMSVDKKGTDAIEKVTIDNAPSSITEGASPVTLKATIVADQFYKNTDDYKNLTISWTCTSNPSGAATIDSKTGVLKASKKGSVSVTASAGGKKSSASTISISGKATDPTKESSTTAGKKSLNGATIKIKKNKKIYKDVSYTAKELKERITVKDSKGKTVDPSNYEIDDYEIDGKYMKITIRGVNDYNGSTNGSVKASSTSNNNNNNNKYKTRTGSTYRTLTPRTVTPGASTSSTGTTVPNVTYAPDRTITVKEVFLGQQIVDEPEPAPTPADMMDAATDDMYDESTNDWAETEDFSLDFGPMAGSAAVAIGACGAGVVGRIRRFKLDTATQAVEKTAKFIGRKK